MSPPRPTRAGRLSAYLQAMLPPAVAVPAGVAHFAAIYLALQALAGQAPLRITGRAAAGALTVVLFTLLLRIYDELKDAPRDLELGRAGDPRYKDRPLVTGHVTLEDLKAFRWGVTGLLILVNLPLGAPLPLAAFAAVFALAWLSLRWFFCPAISRSLLLAFVTHNPLGLAVEGYVVAVYARDFGAGGLTCWTAPLVLGLWAPVAAWETARKVRVPADETDYETYSKVLGWRAAALVPAGFVALSAAALVAVARAAGLGWAYPTALLAGAAAAIGACLLFRLAPTRRRANLRPYAEVHGVVANAGLALALALHHGLRLG